MMSKLFFATLVVVLVFAFSTSGFAQEMEKPEAKKEEAKKEAKPALKAVQCDPACGFMVRSHDEQEIIDVVKTHGKKAHNMEMTDADVKSRMKTAGEMKEMRKERMMKMEMMKKEMMKEEEKKEEEKK